LPTDILVTAPPGLMGGKPGQRGLNLIIRKDGKIINIGGKNSVEVVEGDAIRIMTPGGGGFGKNI